MVKDQAIQKLLTWVSAQVGTREGSNNYNKYAEDPRLTELYGWYPQNQPWCDIFTDEAFIECFGLEKGAALTYQPIGGGSAACRTSAGFFKAHGAFSKVPQPGDVVFFYVSGDINHQGIVIRVYNGSIVTIEGNSSDQVSERVYQLGAANIAGYGRPDWSVVADVPVVDEDAADDDHIGEVTKMVTVELPVLHNGMGGGAVAAAQGALVYHHCSVGPDGVDGDFGAYTRQAVYNFQVRNGLTDDGIIGAETWSKLLEGKT